MRKLLIIAGVAAIFGAALVYISNTGREPEDPVITPESAEQDNDLLNFENITTDYVFLPIGEKFVATVAYGDRIDIETFSAKLNGVDISHLFNPRTNSTEDIELMLELGNQELTMSALSERTAGEKLAGDVDRVTVRVVARADTSGSLHSARMTTIAPEGIPHEPLNLDDLEKAEPGKATLIDKTGRDFKRN